MGILIHTMNEISLNAIVLNSRDRQGMYGMQHFCMPRNPLYNRLQPKNHSCNNAVYLLNTAKSRLFRSIMNFENHVDFCLSAGQPASQPASLPAVRPGCARCRALKITQNMCQIYKTVVLKTIFLLHHGDSFVLP